MISRIIQKTLPHPEKLVFWALKAKGFESHRMSFKNCQLHYILKRGDLSKPWIVFVHGFSANAVHWNPVLTQMAKSGHSIMAVDLPGHGFSEEFKDGLSMDVLFDGLVAMLKEVVPSPFFLVGNSLGGALSLRVAIEKPEIVKGLAVISPAGKFDTVDEWLGFKKELKIDSVSKANEFLAKIYHLPPWYMPLLAPMVVRNVGRKGIGELLESINIKDFDAQAMSLHVPTLFIWGKEERLLPRKQLEWYRNHLSEFVKFEEPAMVGHCPQLDKPGWLTRRLLGFFETEVSAIKKAMGAGKKKSAPQAEV